MTGCANAIAARDKAREAEARCPSLAYGLHKAPWADKCRRLGGARVCADCVGDLREQEKEIQP